jgi:photosystem II stability/assembly factor-like uncharacterized protein
MRREDVRDAIDAMASDVATPDADASAAMARARNRIRRRRLTFVSVVALLAAIVVIAGAIVSDDDGSSRISSVPTTARPFRETPWEVYSGPIEIPISFVSPTEGWLCTGPTMQYTTDAGATWKDVTVPFGSPAPPRLQQPVCAAVAGGEAWLLTTAVRDADDLQVIHVSEGGRTVETAAFPSLRPDWTVRGLSFADSLHGWAFARSAGGGATASFVTSDGGRSWDTDNPLRHAPLWESPSDGWAALDFSSQQQLARTTDGGRSWDRVDMYGYADTLQPIAADGETVVVLGSTPEGARREPSFAVTLDRGDSWDFRQAPRNAVTSATMPAAASALDVDRWWLGAAGHLFATRNGGRSWEQIAQFAGISRIIGVHFLTPEIGFVSAIGTGDAANSSVVLRTDDGGETWPTVATQAPALTRAAHVINTPGGILGCPTHPLAAPPPGDPPAGLVDTAVQNIETTRGWTPVGKQIAYRVGGTGGSFSELFAFQLPSCGPEAVAASWVVELQGAPGSGGGGSTPRAEIVLAYSPDGWHVYGRYH